MFKVTPANLPSSIAPVSGVSTQKTKSAQAQDALLPAPVSARAAKSNRHAFKLNPLRLAVGLSVVATGSLLLLRRASLAHSGATLPGLPQGPQFDAIPTLFTQVAPLAKRQSKEYVTISLSGNSLASIGQEFGFSAAQMAQANPNLPAAGEIAADTRVILPGAPQSSVPTPQPAPAPTPSPTQQGLVGLSLGSYSLPAGPLQGNNAIGGAADATSDQLAWLADPNSEPGIPASGSDAGFSYGAPTNFKLFPNGSPAPSDINQSEVGDCFLDSVIADAANQHSTSLANAVSDVGNGNFNVALFDPNGKPITIGVTSQTLYDGNGYQVSVVGKGNTADFASLMEKAVAKYNTIFQGDKGGAWGGIGNGGTSAWAIQVLTGRPASQMPLSSVAGNPQALGAQLRAILGAGGLVGLGTSQESAYGSATVVGGHEYSLLAATQNSQSAGGWDVTVRNPWGTTPQTSGPSDNSQDGRLTMSIADALSHFQFVDFSS